MMDVKDFCKGMSMELMVWKAKMYDAMRKMDKLGTAERQKMLANIEDIHIIIAELEEKVSLLDKECPSDWSGIKQEIDQGHVDMRAKYEDTMEFIGKAAPVSIPG